LSVPHVDIKLFGKPTAHPYRRMGVALAKGDNILDAREKAKRAANQVQMI
jgi:phosphoribosylglycinamide formyltransferase 2